VAALGCPVQPALPWPGRSSFPAVITRVVLPLLILVTARPESILILGGILLSHATEQFGLELMGITPSVWVMVEILNDFMTFRDARMVKLLGAVVFTVLTLLSYLVSRHLPADIKGFWHSVMSLIS